MTKYTDKQAAREAKVQTALATLTVTTEPVVTSLPATMPIIDLDGLVADVTARYADIPLLADKLIELDDTAHRLNKRAKELDQTPDAKALQAAVKELDALRAEFVKCHSDTMNAAYANPQIRNLIEKATEIGDAKPEADLRQRVDEMVTRAMMGNLAKAIECNATIKRLKKSVGLSKFEANKLGDRARKYWDWKKKLQNHLLTLEEVEQLQAQDEGAQTDTILSLATA